MKPKKDLNMKKLFRRNQVIITALAVMIAAAGYLNYAGKQELAAGSQVYEAGILEISDEDVLAENQASEYYGETLAEIDSLDADILDEEAQEAAMAEEAEVMEEAGTAELDGAAAETVKEAEGAVTDGSGEQLAAAEGTETEGTGTGAFVCNVGIKLALEFIKNSHTLSSFQIMIFKGKSEINDNLY